MAQTAEKEPTMEEILASIRRIISEDAEETPRAQQAPERRPEPFPASEPETTERTQEVPADEPEEALVDDLADDDRTDADILELTDRVEPEPEADEARDGGADIGSRAEDEREEEGRSYGPDPRTVEELLDERLVSDQAERRAGASFAELSAMMVGGYEGSSHTLEGLVREMLKPMLKAWLDENLPRIVEEIVEGEVQRIAAKSRRK